MLSAFLLYNYRGEILISRVYRNELSRSKAGESFRVHVIANPKIQPPIVKIERNYFFYIQHNNLYFVFVVRSNINKAMVFELLYKLVDIFKQYFGETTEASIKENLEVIDFGYPENTEFDTLKTFVSPPGNVKTEETKIKSQVTVKNIIDGTPWRRQRILHRKNEIFLDVVESLESIISSSGKPVRIEVSGIIKVRCHLSGMPHCSVIFNQGFSKDSLAQNYSPIERKNTIMRNCRFHRSVTMNEQMKSPGTIKFIPPDGEFELMRYRFHDVLSMPFKVNPIIAPKNSSQIGYKIIVKPNFDRKLDCVLNVKIPVPRNADGITINAVSSGKAKYQPSDNVITWSILKCRRDSDYSLTASVDLSPETEEFKWERPPIRLEFDIPMYSISGLAVEKLTVDPLN